VKTAVVLLVGAADRPHAGLKGETPLRRARLPRLAALLAEGRPGRLSTSAPGAAPGPQTALPLLFGYAADALPAAGPLEAVGLGREIRADETVFVADLVTLRDGILADPTGGRPREAEARVLRDSLHAALGGEGRLELGSRSYRHLLVLAAEGAGHVETRPPHALTGEEARGHDPEGPGAARLLEVERRAAAVLGAHEVNAIRLDLGENPATALRCWGGGGAPSLAPAPAARGAAFAVVCGPGLARGLAKASGGSARDAGPGGAGAAAEALTALDAGAELVIVVLEDPWERSLDGDAAGKVEALERADAAVIGPLRDGLALRGPWRLAVAAVAGCSSSERLALPEPGPFVLAGEGVPSGARKDGFTETAAAAADLAVEEPGEFLAYAMGR
jgi:2,3-bisphosphoglycerate-independent phosphoglycerate mutase